MFLTSDFKHFSLNKGHKDKIKREGRGGGGRGVCMFFLMIGKGMLMVNSIQTTLASWQILQS